MNLSHGLLFDAWSCQLKPSFHFITHDGWFGLDNLPVTNSVVTNSTRHYPAKPYLFLVGTGGGLAGSPASSLIDSGLLTADCAPAVTAEATADAAAPEAVLKAAMFSFLWCVLGDTSSGARLLLTASDLIRDLRSIFSREQDQQNIMRIYSNTETCLRSAAELFEKGDPPPIAAIVDASSTALRLAEAESIIEDGRDDDDDVG